MDYDEEYEGTKKKDGKPITFKKWSAVAVWRYSINQDTCIICRQNLQEPCLECQHQGTSESGGDNCHIAWGVCNHAFHFHCLSRWLKTRPACPICNKDWNYV
ncbi:putative RING-box protein 1A [Monocercomonoides exilis]|uniref:putative RING-box protein 1A n=1 Tax=Monocercomonoides exilis TaxID=2049356 RepID=UPI00355AC5E2|nr:putative RING-box protein 1A [Monocercomonoides exilis]|eukprot:MONOS_7176.1-p1 / transcript=MONOS_7176.1 / gene=MONOS_7176 / organism=Monocercomonoides_exilis_PA203 / gene_product=ring box protein / transcript_product=ring box protein / location=Mono_scaffold00239:49240-49625(+) / protein_length=101 / sequence_SO=supercontig / SO=protein_coding / is_pseudo=false